MLAKDSNSSDFIFNTKLQAIIKIVNYFNHHVSIVALHIKSHIFGKQKSYQRLYQCFLCDISNKKYLYFGNHIKNYQKVKYNFFTHVENLFANYPYMLNFVIMWWSTFESNLQKGKYFIQNESFNFFFLVLDKTKKQK